MRPGADLYREPGKRAPASAERAISGRSPGAGADGERYRDADDEARVGGPWSADNRSIGTPGDADGEGAGLRRDELRHDALAALLGIEAAARSLSRHRHLLSATQIDELSNGLVAEVDRLRSLLDGRATAPPGRSADRPPASAVHLDLRDAVVPVVVCARAGGQVVLDDVPPGIHVSCDREVVARVLLTLLSNARRHAPGSPVAVGATARRGHVALRVDDRGPGVPAALRARLFVRGGRSDVTGGWGLGLYTARRLLSEQGGAIWHAPRAGGGSTFVMCLRRPAPTVPGAARPAADARLLDGLVRATP